MQFYLRFFIKSLNLEATKTPVINKPVQVAKIERLSAETDGWFTANSVAQVMIFIGTRNQFVTVARWLSGINY